MVGSVAVTTKRSGQREVEVAPVYVVAAKWTVYAA
jgi:hypothetical protein